MADKPNLQEIDQLIGKNPKEAIDFILNAITHASIEGNTLIWVKLIYTLDTTMTGIINIAPEERTKISKMMNELKLAEIRSRAPGKINETICVGYKPTPIIELEKYMRSLLSKYGFMTLPKKDYHFEWGER